MYCLFPEVDFSGAAFYSPESGKFLKLLYFVEV